MTSKESLLEVFITKSNESHNFKYNYSLVEYKNNRTKVKIICPVHGVFEQVPTSHTRGIGCMRCGKDSISKQFTKTTKQFITEAIKVHGDKYDYSLVLYKGCKDKVDIICKNHGNFRQTPTGHMSGKGCSKCAREKVKGVGKISLDEWKLSCAELHDSRYNYDKVSFEVTRDVVDILCNKHEEYFRQSAAKHRSGYGCYRCGLDRISESRASNTQDFIIKATELHGDRYCYDLVEYTRSNKKVSIICKSHGIFKQVPNSHLNGNGCPSCVQSGFNAQISGSFYIVRWYGFCEEFLKFGVTNQEVTKRVSSQFNKASLDYEILFDFKFGSGYDCLDIERNILKDLECKVCPKKWLPDGYTETTSVDNLPKILEYIKLNYGLDPEDYKYSE